MFSAYSIKFVVVVVVVVVVVAIVLVFADCVMFPYLFIM